MAMIILRNSRILLLLMFAKTEKVPHTTDTDVTELDLRSKGITEIGEFEFSK